jgi:hypothetical protein
MVPKAEGKSQEKGSTEVLELTGHGCSTVWHVSASASARTDSASHVHATEVMVCLDCPTQHCKYIPLLLLLL